MSLSRLKQRLFRRGFSLIEMLLVITLIAVIAGLSVPSFRNSFKTIELKNQSQEFVYLMRYAQGRTVTKGTRIKLNLDLGSKKYFLTEAESDDDSGAKKPLNFVPIKGRMGQVKKISPKIQLESNAAVMNFFPDGTIDKAQIRLCLDRECYVISTQEQRGNIRYYSSAK